MAAVTAVVHVTPLAGNDEHLEEEYEVRIQEGVDPKDYATVALDVFHSSIPVDPLEDYEFHVTVDGAQVCEPDDSESYTMSNKGHLV